MGINGMDVMIKVVNEGNNIPIKGSVTMSLILGLDEFGNALLTCMPNVMIWKKLIWCLMNFLFKIWPNGIGYVCQMWSSRKI